MYKHINTKCMYLFGLIVDFFKIDHVCTFVIVYFNNVHVYTVNGKCGTDKW